MLLVQSLSSLVVREDRPSSKNAILTASDEKPSVITHENGKFYLTNHLKEAAMNPNNVVETRVGKWGTFIKKEFLLAGPSGKFRLLEAVWHVTEDGLRFVSPILKFRK